MEGLVFTVRDRGGVAEEVCKRSVVDINVHEPELEWEGSLVDARNAMQCCVRVQDMARS